MFNLNQSNHQRNIKQSFEQEWELQTQLRSLGFFVDFHTGHIFYHDSFKPFPLKAELVFIRHGETYGNCGQSSKMGTIDQELVISNIKITENRIYQGNVDTEINQLTKTGKEQALTLRDKLQKQYIEKGWIPDFIFISPLKRALATSLPFILHNQFQDKCIIHEGIREIGFGAWENKRLCDLAQDHMCHRFYRDQDALVKEDNYHTTAENFCDLLLRAHGILQELNRIYAGKKVMMFSHSMFGAALSFLLGHAQKIEEGEYLAFDGKRRDGSSYALPHAEPCFLSSKGKKKSYQMLQ